MELFRDAKILFRPFFFGFLLGLVIVGSFNPSVRNYIAHLIEIAYAASGIIDPDGDGTTGGTATTCTSSLHWECINDAVRSPTAPSTAGDYISLANTNQNYSTLGTISNVQTATSVAVSVYHAELNANMATYVSLWDAAQTTQYGTEVQLTNRNGAANAAWDTANFTGLSLTQANLDGMRLRLRCARPAGGGTNSCREYAAYATVNYSPVINVTVSAATSTQQGVDRGATNAYVGGAFVITENTSSRNITSITINETGTVDGLNSLDNIKLLYELDSTSPYNCASVSYNGTETQYGSTDTTGFSAANGSSVFTGSVGISTTQAMCVYVVVDVLSGAAGAETIEVQITDPSTEVVGSGSAVVGPSSAIALAGTSNVLVPDLQQVHYHWRDDDNVENAASSLTGGVDDTAYSQFPAAGIKRLRIEVSNEGTGISATTTYRIDYASKVTTCSAATGWLDVGAVGGHFDMGGSGSQLTEGSATTDIAEAIGGVANENTDFVGTGGQKETSSQTSGIRLSATQFYEIEYALEATVSAVVGATYCFKVTDAGADIDPTPVYAEATIAADLLVTATSSQVSIIDVPTTSAYNGGGFVITDSSAGSHTISAITITASGTVDKVNDIDNIILWHETDTVAPYNCTGELFDGDETQYGVTDTNGFSATGTATFTGSISVSPTQGICLYVEYDVLSSASDGETIELRITNPQTDIVLGAGSLSPATLVDITGVSHLVEAITEQAHYHWRNNDDVENAASSATGGTDDTTLSEMSQATTYRLRMGVANTGGTSTPLYQYRLEWGQKVTTCSAVSTWVDTATAGDEFSIVASQLVDGANTTDIAEGIGGVSNDGLTFYAANSGQEDSSSQTGSIRLPSDNMLELEYSLQATASTSEGASYCFKVTNAGTDIEVITYAEAIIKIGTDFVVTRNFATIPNGASTVTITEGVEYDLQLNSASRAFIRITNTAYTGAGPANTGNHSSSDVTAYISNPNNIATSITFTRAGTADTSRISWEVVEYIGDTGGENEIVVRSASTATYGAAATTVTTGTVSGIVTDADVVPFITGQGNVNTGRFDYNTGLSTSAWNSGADTATFTRGEGANANSLSYAILEFTGANWKIQRSEHTYVTIESPTDTPESESITPVNSITRAFLHTQKRVGSGLDTHAEFGHRVYLSGVGTIQYQLESNATTPGSHASVAWVIENTQTTGKTMKVWQSSGTVPSGGTPPTIAYRNIGATLSDISVASIFAMSSANNTNRTFQEPIISARLLNSSSTQYELWVGDTTDTVAYRTEVVEWPTAAAKLYQNYFRFYVDNDALDPTDPWPAGGADLGENDEITALDDPLALGEAIRIRMTLNVTAASLPSGVDAFRLEYGERFTSCDAITTWRQIGDTSSSTALWRGNAATPVDGTALSTNPPAGGALNIVSVADVAGTYEEENPSAFTPYTALVDRDIEFDWNIEHNGASDKTDYCFRMTSPDGTELEGYNFYPVVRTVGYSAELWDWKWFDDENSATPVSSLAATNSAPIDIAIENSIKMRVVLSEVAGATGNNVKFKVQFSEYPDFSTVSDVVSTTSCQEDSLWCYADGAGVNNAIINDNTLASADACSGGVGVGCGTHNEGTSTVGATFDHQALTDAEFEFTLKHAGARANAVYYFRLYDTIQNEVVLASTTYPSLVTEGASLTFSVGGLTAGTVTEGETLDVESTPGAIAFGDVPFDTEYTAGYRLQINTNATEGFQILMYGDQLLNSYGSPIPPITGTNASPLGWGASCSVSAIGCFGYHVGDDLLQGGSARFAANDSYAALSSTPEEVMYSSIPMDDTHDIVYKLQISEEQPAGDYEATINFLAIPIF